MQDESVLVFHTESRVGTRVYILHVIIAVNMTKCVFDYYSFIEKLGYYFLVDVNVYQVQI